jgi:hypothetical protein
MNTRSDKFSGGGPVTTSMRASVFALDPGPTKSALVRWNGRAVTLELHAPNEEIAAILHELAITGRDPLVIEQVASYGMPVGAEVFETCVWTGRFMEIYGAQRTYRLPRLQVKLHLCHDSRAKDANIRAALIDRFGGKELAIGRKAAPGPLYGVHGDLWASLALAIAWLDTNSARSRSEGAAA